MNVLQQISKVLHSMLFLQCDRGNHNLHRRLDDREEARQACGRRGVKRVKVKGQMLPGGVAWPLKAQCQFPTEEVWNS